PLAVGDCVVFTRRFGEREAAAFAELSGDQSPLHRYDSDPQVAMNLAAAPLSRIAGIVFPGDPGLCLTQARCCLWPVPFDHDIANSTRVTAISHAQKVLTLRVLAVNGARVLFQATMRVHARFDPWQTPPAEPIRRGPGTALVAGAAGEIGAAVAARLAW